MQELPFGEDCCFMFHCCPAQCLWGLVLPTSQTGSHHRSDLQQPPHSIFHYLQKLLCSFCCLLILKKEELRGRSAVQSHSWESPGFNRMKECSCIPAPCSSNHEYSKAGFDAWHGAGKGKGSQKVDHKNQCSGIHHHLVSPFYRGGYNVFLF